MFKDKRPELGYIFNINNRQMLETMYTCHHLYNGSIENLRAHLSMETNFNDFCQIIQNFFGYDHGFSKDIILAILNSSLCSGDIFTFGTISVKSGYHCTQEIPLQYEIFSVLNLRKITLDEVPEKEIYDYLIQHFAPEKVEFVRNAYLSGIRTFFVII